ncbi:MAG: DUF1761 domain-containing protein [Acidimicrobiales bacterium]
MTDVNVVAVSVAAVAGFEASGLHYTILGDRLAAVSSAAASPEATPGWTYPVEVARTAAIVIVVAGLAAHADINSIREGLLLGLALWIGFPAMLWIGAIIHERTPTRLAAIHAGDWFIKLSVIAIVAWH